MKVRKIWSITLQCHKSKHLMKAVLSLNHTEVTYTLLVYKTSHTMWKNKLNRKPTLSFIQATLHNNRNYWFYPGKARKKTTCFFSVKRECSQASNTFWPVQGVFLHYYWNVLCHEPCSFTFCWRYTYAIRDVSDIFPLRKPCVVTFNQTLFTLPTLQNINTGYKNVSTRKE